MMTVTIRSSQIEAEISPLGAELRALRDSQGREWLWDGDPAWWNGRSPILFPIVGTLNRDTLRVDGEAYSLPRHGFARRSTFTLRHQGEDSVLFGLSDSQQTRAIYPFAFDLEMRYAVLDNVLTMAATLRNPGNELLTASFGYHPALRWPLPPGGAREEHVILFDEAEPAPVRRLDADGLLAPHPRPTPVAGDCIRLDGSLFAEDALIFDRPASRGLTFTLPGQEGVYVKFEGMPHLALWSKPDAPFLCIEPWQGHSDPAGFDGEFREKPGVISLAPDQAHTFTMTIAIGA